MFESLTEKLGQALRGLRGVSKLTEENMAEALREVRTALLAADVHFRVARDFVERVQQECVGREVLKGVAPYTARQFARAIVMPNLKPPVTTTAQALAYRDRIRAARPAGSDFEPLMTLYLTDNLPADEIKRALAAERHDIDPDRLERLQPPRYPETQRKGRPVWRARRAVSARTSRNHPFIISTVSGVAFGSQQSGLRHQSSSSPS